MSNRVWGIIIICVFMIVILSFYLYFFVYYTGGISVNSNLDNYKVNLYSKKLYKTFSFDCKNKICNLSDLSPLDYQLTIVKSWYIDYMQDITIVKNSVLKLKVDLKKDIKLEKNKTSIESPISNQQRIDKIKNSKIYYAYFYLDNLWSFYFKNNNLEWLDLFYENKSNSWELKKIWNFEKVDASKIRVDKVYGSDFFYLQLWDDKLLYDLKSLNYKKLDLKLDTLYIKQWLMGIFLINTLKWTFIYDFENNKLDYFSIFSDFIFYKNWYLAIIKKDDTIRINNFWLDIKNNKDKIIFWNNETKQKKLIYETEIDINKLIYIDSKVIFMDKSLEEFSLNELEI